MTYHNSPGTHKIHGCPDTWKNLINYDFTIPDVKECYNAKLCKDIAWIMRNAANRIHVTWGYWGTNNTFATPERAKDFLERAGYAGVVKHKGYKDSEAAMFKALKTDCPVFMSGISGTVDGHAWVIDGALQRRRRVDTYLCDTLYSSRMENSSEMVHCNWGWGGPYNGYYTSGLFNLQRRQDTAPGDKDGDEDDKTNFTWHFRVITYDKPKK